MSEYSRTPRTTLHRRPSRGAYDRATVHAILDEALVCHLGFDVEGQPFVLPTTFVREDERVYVHGAGAGRLFTTLARGVPVGLGVTLVDGLVLSRSAFHHSMNYRSVLVLGTARAVTDREEKLRALALLVDKVSPGRSGRARPPNDKELAVTLVLSLALEEVSAKVRSGPPIEDDDEDLSGPLWTGVVPIALRAGAPRPVDEAARAFEPPLVPSALGALRPE